MVERSIITTLRLNVRDFVAGTKTAGSSLDELIKKGDKTGQVSSTGMGRMQQSLELQRGSWDQASASMLGWGAAATVAVSGVVATFANFDQAMSSVQAATHESARNMGILREAAIEAGADSAFSATEAAGAIEELAKAGISTSDILGGGLVGSLDLAAAGELGVSEAAGIASIALTQFGLAGKDVGHVADLLAAGAGKAMGDVTDLGMALKQSGLVAAQTGLSIEETTGGLAAFASAGLLGADAGTSFKSMLQRLTPQSKEAKAKMEELGISAYDAQGNFIGLSAFAGNLQDSLKGLTNEQRNSAMATIFGSDAVRGASVLYEQGAVGIEKWITAVDDSGYAAETAAARMDNLKGDWEQFTGSLESVFLKSGSGINDMLRNLVQGAEDLADTIGGIPGPVLEAGLGLMAFVGIGGLVVGGSMKMMTATYDAYKAFQALKLAAPGLSAGLAGVAKSAGGVSLALAAAVLTAASVKTVRNGILGISKADNGLEYVENRLVTAAEAGSVYATVLGDVAESGALAGNSFQTVGDAVSQLANQDLMDKLVIWSGLDANGISDVAHRFESLDGVLAEMSFGDAAAQFKKIADEAIGTGATFEEVQQVFPRFAEAVAAIATEQGISTEAAWEQVKANGAVTTSTGEVVTALGDVEEAATAAKVSLFELQNQMLEQAGTVSGLHSAISGWEETFAETAGLIAENGQSMDLMTESGRKNVATLDAMAASGQGVASSMSTAIDANGNLIYSEQQVQEMMEGVRAAFIEAAIQAGATSEEANKLADNLGLIPGNYSVNLEAVSNFETPIGAYELRLAGLPSEVAAALVARDDVSVVVGLVKKALDEGIPAETLTRLQAEDEASYGILLPLAERIAAIPRDVTSIFRGADFASAPAATVKTAVESIPPAKTSVLHVNDMASGKLSYVKGVWDSIRDKTVTVRTNYVQSGSPSPVQTFQDALGWKATGGPIFGPGTGTSDSVPIWASNGEHMLSAGEVQAAGGQQAIYALRAVIRGGGIKPLLGLAAGGAVGPSQAVSVAFPAAYRSPVINLTAIVEHPFTGEQMTARVQSIAADEALRYVNAGA